MYKDPAKQREFQKLRLRKRRAAWFAANGPCIDCGSWENLELDHVDPASKVTNSVWSWTQTRQDVELAKCVVRCRSCHVTKTRPEKSGERASNAKLKKSDVIEIRRAYAARELTQHQLAERFKVNRRTIGRIISHELWPYV